MVGGSHIGSLNLPELRHPELPDGSESDKPLQMCRASRRKAKVDLHRAGGVKESELGYAVTAQGGGGSE
jgi:hypothetical protein